VDLMRVDNFIRRACGKLSALTKCLRPVPFWLIIPWIAIDAILLPALAEAFKRS
jgi:hypothetical protein